MMVSNAKNIKYRITLVNCALSILERDVCKNTLKMVWIHLVLELHYYDKRHIVIMSGSQSIFFFI